MRIYLDIWPGPGPVRNLATSPSLPVRRARNLARRRAVQNSCNVPIYPCALGAEFGAPWRGEKCASTWTSGPALVRSEILRRPHLSLYDGQEIWRVEGRSKILATSPSIPVRWARNLGRPGGVKNAHLLGHLARPWSGPKSCDVPISPCTTGKKFGASKGGPKFLQRPHLSLCVGRGIWGALEG